MALLTGFFHGVGRAFTVPARLRKRVGTSADRLVASIKAVAAVYVKKAGADLASVVEAEKLALYKAACAELRDALGLPPEGG
jgi:hypothetical protein